MIGSLRGTLVDSSDGEVLLEVFGVGYRVQMPATTAAALSGEVFVYTHHHVREDAETLFGFLTLDERRTFEILLAAHGVGPSMAMAILSIYEPSELARVVAAGDGDALCLVSGVGKKTAARLLIELKSRLDLPEVGAGASDFDPATSSVLGDVREALLSLGYGPDEIRDALAGQPSDGDVGDTLKSALRVLAGAR
ncbi:MAG: Holliday junction branch migration protein RuvA [Acidimicrobiales bacterium]